MKQQKTEPPFKVGDVVSISPENIGKGEADVLRVITKIKWVGEKHCESGWLVDAKPGNPSFAGMYDMEAYDSKWFTKE